MVLENTNKFLSRSLLPIEGTQQLPLNLGVMIMKGSATLSRFPELEPHNQMKFNVIPEYNLYGEVLLFVRDTISAF